VARRRCVASSSPAWKLASAAASARVACSSVRGQRGRALEERRRGRDAAAALRASGRALEVGGHGLVRSGGRQGAVPGAAVGGEHGIAHLRERVVDAPSLVDRCGLVDGCAHQRVAEANPIVDLEQSGLRRVSERARVRGEPVGGAPQQRGVAQRVRCR
jgi:hypothetical protein